MSGNSTIQDTPILRIWKITESREELMQQCFSQNINCSHITEIKSDKRACEMLAELLLIKEFFGNESAELCHTEEGAPFIKDSQVHISITHSRDIVCLGVSYSCPIGIDLEFGTEKIIRVRQKFLNEEELVFFPEDDTLRNRMAWSAKEAVYKAASVKGIDLKEYIRLNKELSLATFRNNGKEKHFTLTHQFFYDMGLVVAIARPLIETI